MSVFNKLSGEGQAINNHIVQYYWTISKEKLAPSEKATPSEEVEKGTKTSDDIDNTKFTEKLELPEHIYSLTPNNKRK